jgi:hypothetical protein
MVEQQADQLTGFGAGSENGDAAGAGVVEQLADDATNREQSGEADPQNPRPCQNTNV